MIKLIELVRVHPFLRIVRGVPENKPRAQALGGEGGKIDKQKSETGRSSRGLPAYIGRYLGILTVINKRVARTRELEWIYVVGKAQGPSCTMPSSGCTSMFPVGQGVM